MKHILPSIVVVIGLLFTREICGGAEPVFLREREKPQKFREGLLLFIAADGRLFSDSGPTDEQSLQDTFKKWRADGTEPGIRLVLYPALQSNSDLKTIRRIIDLLRTNQVDYDIMLEALAP